MGCDFVKKVFLSFVMLLVMPLVVNAQSVDTASAYLDLELPDSWYVFTRDNLDNNSDLEELELTKDYVMDYFLEYDLYVNAFDEDYDFYVYMNTTEDIGNLDDYYNFEVDDLAVELMNMYGANSYEIYDNDYKFIRMDYESDGYYILDYYTIIDDKSYIFSIEKLTEINNDDQAIMEDIVDSIHFDNYVDNGLNEIIIVSIGVSIVVILMLIVYIVSRRQDKKVSQETV